MSKKKAFSGSTMTLKDFHGGSIPSDLSLPSAPGVLLRTSDRSHLGRQIPGTWGNPSNRSDYRFRPGSSATSRNFDEKASFPAHVGRNFDEDERKPLDIFARLSNPDDDNEDHRSAIRIALSPKPEPFSGRPQSNTGAPRVSQFQGVNNGQASASSVPNAWATRNELGYHQQEHSFKEETPILRFTQANALEKVSSGQWQSKLASTAQHKQPGVYVLRFAETENNNVQQNKVDLICTEGYQSYNSGHVNARCDLQSYNVDHVNDIGDFDTHMRYGDGVRVNKEFLDYESGISPGRNSGVYSLEYVNHGSQLNSDEFHPASADCKLGQGLQSQLLPHVPERPKLNLLPRTTAGVIRIPHLGSETELSTSRGFWQYRNYKPSSWEYNSSKTGVI